MPGQDPPFAQLAPADDIEGNVVVGIDDDQLPVQRLGCFKSGQNVSPLNRMTLVR
jgi:hypothetical protein